MFSMGVGVLMLMGLGFTVVALPVAILYLVFKGLSGIFWIIGAVFGFFGRLLGGLFGGLGKGLGGVGKGIFGVVRHLFRFGRGMVGDALRLVGGILTAVFILPLFLFNLALLRLRAARHYAGAIEDELASCFLSIYRLGIGHPARLCGLTALTEGFERRIPDVIARAPGTITTAGPVVKGDTRSFEGYRILGQLKSGGSGGRLYLAEPSDEKRAWLRQGGNHASGRVVIKSFALEDGSTLPQIVRESRALEAARELGLVLEHELTPRRFHYVMPYVDGDELSVVARRMHDASGPDGLVQRHLENALSYSMQLLETLDRFHGAGLWHKDIKPSNILVSDGRVHLVDLGLVTPLASAMTLTTHGTEYFRDPEMVRLAMRGVKVHEVDGVKFDLYSAGAVVYSVVENSFPAHGSLSQITRRCPEALAWIVRRAMADMQSRYTAAGEMLRDLRVLAQADDPFAVRPADLPSFKGVPFVPSEQRPDPFARPVEVDTDEVRAARLAARLAPAAKDEIPPKRRRGKKVAARTATSEPLRKRRRRRMARAIGVAAALIAFWLVGGVTLTRQANQRATQARWDVERRHVAELERRQAEVDSVTLALAEYEAALLTTRTLETAELDKDRHDEIWNRVMSGATVLVLADLPPTEEFREILGRLYERLSVQDYDVLGLSDQGLGAPDDRELELLPLAWIEIGASLPSDPEVAARLEAFLRVRTDVDDLVWLVQGPRGRLLDGLVVTPAGAQRIGSTEATIAPAPPQPAGTHVFYGDSEAYEHVIGKTATSTVIH